MKRGAAIPPGQRQRIPGTVLEVAAAKNQHREVRFKPLGREGGPQETSGAVGWAGGCGLSHWNRKAAQRSATPGSSQLPSFGDVPKLWLVHLQLSGGARGQL